MRYKILKENQKILLNNNRKNLAFHCLSGTIAMGFILINTWNDSLIEIKLTLITVLIFLLFFWLHSFYSIKNRILTEFEIKEGYLYLYNLDRLKKKIEILSLKKVIKMKLGYVIEFEKENVYIFEFLENKEDLINQIK